MSIAIVTGSAGLIGSEMTAFLHEQGMDVIGIDNDMRAYFFGDDASTRWNTERLRADLPRFTPTELDVRDAEGIGRLFAAHGSAIELVVHAAAQPSHDWAAACTTSSIAEPWEANSR